MAIDALLIVAWVWAMPHAGLEISTKRMTAGACAAHVALMTERFRKGGRWAQSFRFRETRCVPIQ